ncbi:hypothetical protein L1889_10450 [Paenalcaligenes niemegkensis]|uniref:hypothetical protein n=1 Tax=Paenalcaligenes niemegkensis TaxID=2895469 RepID=UPI001EE9047B|nr:hypothetical protein [Paenalcaligenes niemegkensis]MCQ9617073.1 hypothetical protein [Paenalcaligenes niemegkensis]
MHKLWIEYKDSRLSGILGPGADIALAPLAAPEIKRRVLIAHLAERYRHAVQRYAGFPLGRLAFHRWMHNKAGKHHVESFGLPRHIVEEVLGDAALTLHVDPRKLIRITAHAPRSVEKRPSSLAFIWNGTWDQRREDLRFGSRYKLIRDLDKNRDQLECTERFQELMALIESGKPRRSHQQGVCLNTPEKIHAYLNIYIGFLDDMATNGFDPTRGKDPLGVAISSEGRILKINRGLHRLAMAQHIGLPSIPVRVRAVHRLWWDRVTEGSTGAAALEKVCLALPQCLPEESPGLFDDVPEQSLLDDFWPAPLPPSQSCS